MRKASLRSVLAADAPLVTPLAHDALSARLIEQAGFKAFTIGGSALLASRHAYPDIGLIGLADMVAGMRDISAATTIPFLADGDDGYGDVKSVARMIHAYEDIGVGGVLIEDQDRDKKQQRAEKALGVVDEEVICRKLRVALAARRDKELMVIGRTDAYGALGLDAALKRAERYVALGCDGIFVAGLRTEQDYRRVGRALKGQFLSAAMFEAGDTPWISPRDLFEMGFRHVSFPVSMILRVVGAMRSGLYALREFAEGRGMVPPLADAPATRAALDQAVGLAAWRGYEALK